LPDTHETSPDTLSLVTGGAAVGCGAVGCDAVGVGVGAGEAPVVAVPAGKKTGAAAGGFRGVDLALGTAGRLCAGRFAGFLPVAGFLPAGVGGDGRRATGVAEGGGLCGPTAAACTVLAGPLDLIEAAAPIATAPLAKTATATPTATL
jgi:hypothetical protein